MPDFVHRWGVFDFFGANAEAQCGQGLDLVERGDSQKHTHTHTHTHTEESEIQSLCGLNECYTDPYADGLTPYTHTRTHIQIHTRAHTDPVIAGGRGSHDE